jgi:hypothetical protein
MKYTVNNTMMRIDLPKPLKKGEKVIEITSRINLETIWK